jgi:predicted MPP superfamily phosphohydrolase/tetratricopeptide (TPR) repeat protein
MKSVSWLHLSDLHVGQKSQWAWPTFREQFLKDLRRLADIAGPIDLVLFSGDLTQKGETVEFDTLTRELSAIWEELDKLNQRPSLFAVPGNHDLQRPASNDARVKVLKGWSADPDVREELWSTPSNQYLEVIQAAFRNYSIWFERLPSSGIPTVGDALGILPGDSSASVIVNDVRVGLVGLNSAFLQLGNEDYNGLLALDGRQLSAVTGNDPPAWCAQHDVNLLLTHHPVTWLTKSAQQEFNAEIFPSGRFTAHLFGHMHEAALATVFRGGDGGRRAYQSPSLFGMEYLGDGATERAHGYTAVRVVLADTAPEMKIWPRKGRLNKSSGQRKLVPDHDSFDLDENQEYLTEPLQRSGAGSVVKISSATSVDLAITTETTDPTWINGLKSTSYPLPEDQQHSFVRHLQQQIFSESIRRDKAVWVCADWGLGRDGFLGSAVRRIGRGAQPVYRIDLANYATREDFLTRFQTMTGCSFTEYSKALSGSGGSVVLLDDAPVTLGEQRTELMERDAEELASMVRDFCADVIVILLSRTKPKVHDFEVIRLDPLDEADTRTYLLEHHAASAESRTEHAVSEIFRHTEGFPGKIDRALKTLRVVSLAELGLPVTSVAVATDSTGEVVPTSLVRAVAEVASSTEPDLKRAYLLLKVLTILPSGESLQRLKRVEHDSPIFPKHAEELLERDLIQVRSSTALIQSEEGEESHIKILVAPRSVRDYVLSKMTAREIDSFVRKAASLYFGDGWRVGTSSLKRHVGLMTSDDGSLRQNPQFLVGRLLASPTTWRDANSAAPILALCKAYCQALQEGSNYRHSVTVCRDMLAIIPESGFAGERDDIEVMLAKSLRMTGEHEDAEQLYARLLKKERPKSLKANMLLNYALCLASLDKLTEAATTAREVISLAPKTAMAAQAESIILETQEGIDSAGELLRLETEARTKGFNTVANNLVLNRAEKTVGEVSDLESALGQVYVTATEGDDRYTAARAVIGLASHNLSKGRALSDEDLNRLIGVYHYSYGERFSSIFNSAHESLWTVFETRKDARNLLALFRHSSFVWRLRGEEHREQPYVQRLKKAARQVLTTDVLTADQNTAYFLMRAQADALIENSAG